MFTGLVQDIGVVKKIESYSGSLRLSIETGLILDDVAIGASISCSGCCLTVIEKSDGIFIVDVSRETIDKTHIGSWIDLDRVNVEPSLRLGDEMGGHIVSGHVDCLGMIEDIIEDAGSYRITIGLPDAFAPYVASKGSIAVDGVSLTVNEVDGASFGVNIIPHTWTHTTLSDRQVGDNVNIEVDMLARYVGRMMEYRK